MSDLRRIGTKRNGARNPEWGSGENGKFAVVLTKPEYPTSSWWVTEKPGDRVEFVKSYTEQLPRMMSVKVSGNQLPNTVLD